jgi:HlyD family secretion protein
MDTSALLAKLHIAQMQAQQLTVGAPATVTIPGVPEPVPAKVALISPALDPGSTTVEVWLRVENPKGSYRVGTAVRATIEGQTVADALTIPAEAVQTAPDGVTKSVMLIGSDGAAHKHGITLGIQTPSAVQVRDGVAPTDSVITTGAYALDDGTKVKIGTPPASADDDKGDDAKEKGDK